MKYQKIIAFLFLVTMISSCYQDDIMNIETIDLISAERVYLNTIKGQVIDTLGDPISMTILKMGDKSTVTDENGRFEIIDVMIPSSGEFLSATHSSHFEGGIRVYATAPITQIVKISLVPRGPTQNFSNKQGATLKVADLAEVTIPSDAFMNKGQMYEGMVTLEVYLVNPNDPMSFNKRIQVFEACGSCTSVYSGAEKILKPELNSILYIEAYDESGEILTLSSDKKVNIKMPTYGTDLIQPTLFSFDDEIGFWKAESEAKSNGAEYEVELNHFSWWGVGLAKIADDLCITFTNVEPSDDHFSIVSNTDGRTLYLGTINYGEETCFPAALGEPVEIRVFNSCFKEIFGTSLMTNQSGATEATVDVENAESNGYLIEIEVVDCDGTILEDTVTVFYSTDLSLDSLDRGVGTFDLTLDECFQSEELHIIVQQNVGNIEYTFTEPVNINETQNQYNIQIVACQDVMPIDGHLTVNGITYSDVLARQNPQETLIIARDGNKEILLGFDGKSVGSFPARIVSFNSNVFCEGKVDVSAYGGINDYIEGTFEIPENVGLGCERVVGEFKAKREK